MSKREKLHQRLFAIPPPKDFTWDELITLMRGYGFKESCSSGSHYIFEHIATDFRCRASKTHPSGLLKRYQIDNIKEAINHVNSVSEKENEQST